MLLCSRARISRGTGACTGKATPQPIRTAYCFVCATCILALAWRRLNLGRIVRPATNISHNMGQLWSSPTRTKGTFHTASHCGNVFVQLHLITYGQNFVSMTRNVPRASVKKNQDPRRCCCAERVLIKQSGVLGPLRCDVFAPVGNECSSTSNWRILISAERELHDKISVTSGVDPWP